VSSSSTACTPEKEVRVKELRISLLVDLAWFNASCEPLLIDPKNLVGDGLKASLALFTNREDDCTYQSLFMFSKLVVSGVVYTYNDITNGRTQKFFDFIDELESVGIDEFSINREHSSDDQSKARYREVMLGDINNHLDDEDVDFVVLFCDHKILQSLPEKYAGKIFAFSDVKYDSVIHNTFRVKQVKGRDVFVYKSMYRTERQL